MEVISLLKLFKRLFGIHSPSKLLCEQTVRTLGEAQRELEEWKQNNSEEIKNFQTALGISPPYFLKNNSVGDCWGVLNSHRIENLTRFLEK